MQIYAMQNLGNTGVKYKTKRHGFLWLKKKMVGTKTTPGACLGYSIQWARKKVEGASDLATKPNMMEGMLMQQRIEQVGGNWDDRIKTGAKSMGVTATLSDSGSYNDVIAFASNNSGYYIVDIGNHFVGMGKSGHEWYYFDANDGLYTFDEREEFTGFVAQDIETNYTEAKAKTFKAYQIKA
jgi:hypothetical protein